MSIFDDPALRLRAEPVVQIPTAGQRFRFRPGSTFVRNFDLSHDASGIIEARYHRDGVETLNVMIEGVGYCTGVPAREVEPNTSNQGSAQLS